MTLSVTINGHNYNTDDYNNGSNPYGLGAGGWRLLVTTFVYDILADVFNLGQMSATDSLTIGTGSKTFTPATMRGVKTGTYCYAIADTNDWMYGQITTVTSTQITINVITVAGAGTFAAWTLQLTSPPATVSAGPSYLSDGGTQTTNFTAASNTRYLVDDTGGSLTLTLPASPAAKDTIIFTKLGLNLVTLGLSSLKYRGQTTLIPAFRSPGVYTLVYTGASQGWVVDRQLTEFASQNTNFTAIGGGEWPVDCTSGAVTATVPTANGTNGSIRFKKFGTNTLTIAGTVNGATNLVVSGEGAIDLFDSGASRGWV